MKIFKSPWTVVLLMEKLVLVGCDKQSISPEKSTMVEFYYSCLIIVHMVEIAEKTLMCLNYELSQLLVLA